VVAVGSSTFKSKPKTDLLQQTYNANGGHPVQLLFDTGTL